MRVHAPPTPQPDTVNGAAQSSASPESNEGPVGGRSASARLRGFVPGSGCLVFSGHGDLTVTLATTTGPLTLTGDMHSSGTGRGAELYGRLGSAAYRGVAAFGPDPDHLDETCFTKPLEHFVSIGALVFATS